MIEKDEEKAAIEQVLSPKSADIGGVIVRRLFPVVGRKHVGPWVFFDEMGPVDFQPGAGLNVKPHPHIGLATVTYLFEGEILHRDSLGTVQTIRPGDINLMVAGRGIVHSERERPEVTAEIRRLHGLQLWLALPEADETCEPAFHHVSAVDIPQVSVNDVTVRVMIGKAYGAESPVPVYSETLYLEAFLLKGQRLQLPDTEERAVYVCSGTIAFNEQQFSQHELVILAAGKASIGALEDTRIAVVGGEYLGPRHINWNFVSSRREQISKAREDWKAGRFPQVPGDDEFIPLPE